ncbi:glycosyltransferase family 2 protein [Clostridium sp. AL.422]|uniref:glycosyltransferase family 2 protein n=1 Tax=Clostridium TaxID=1485 RepID=UPI00293DE75F|nr:MULTISPECIES: glycosyltransferase family 2 protein [unclassified Clostridium]MDV4150291.1 glycosyltransferase family 2 protein [Clostridium sp. AL.422]
MNNVILSVIVPIYNAEKFLTTVFKCIEKKNEDIEVILVDDGSTDSSGKLCNEFIKQSSNVKYIYQENKGVSAARNKGIKNAKGDWIIFLDSDDFMSEDWNDILVESIQKNNLADVILLSNEISGQDYGNFECAKAAIGANTLNEVGSSLCWVFSKIYSRKFLVSNNIFFYTGMINGEDMLFNFEAFIKAHKIVGVNKSYYCFFKNMQSSTNKFNLKIVDTEEYFHRMFWKLLCDNHLSEKKEWLYIYKKSLLTGLYTIIYRVALSKWKIIERPILHFTEQDEYNLVLKELKIYKADLSRIQRIVLGCLKNRMVVLSIFIMKMYCRLKSIYYIKNKNGIIVKI